MVDHFSTLLTVEGSVADVKVAGDDGGDGVCAEAAPTLMSPAKATAERERQTRMWGMAFWSLIEIIIYRW